MVARWLTITALVSVVAWVIPPVDASDPPGRTCGGIYDEDCWHAVTLDAWVQCASYVNTGSWHNPLGGYCWHNEPPGGNSPGP